MGATAFPPGTAAGKAAKKKARNGEKAQPAHRPQMHPSCGRSPQCRIWGFPVQSGAEDPQRPTHTYPDTSTANLRPAAFIFRGGQMIRRGAAFLCFLIRRLFLSPATRPPRTPVAAPKDKTHKKSHTHPRGALLMANTAPRPPPSPFSGLFCPPQAPSGRRESSVPDEPARKP